VASGEARGKVLHPALSERRRRQLARRGAVLFDGGRHFAAHECWEEIWRSTTPEPRDLWQGLVQLAAAFHHLKVRRRPEAARRVLGKAGLRLARVSSQGAEAGAGPAGPAKLASLLAQIATWSAWLDAPGVEEPAAIRLCDTHVCP
jgi:hypothetical protein